MSTEELQLIVTIFDKVTDGALIGGLSYLVVGLLKSITPWLVAGWVCSKLVDRLPKIKRRET